MTQHGGSREVGESPKAEAMCSPTDDRGQPVDPAANAIVADYAGQAQPKPHANAHYEAHEHVFVK